MKQFFILLISILFFISCDNNETIPYNTGLKVFKDFDSTRKFDTTSTANAPMYYRPVKIDLFYPSNEQPSNPGLTYGDILDMYEQRMNYNNPIDSCKKVSLDLAKAIAEYLKIDSSSKILNYKTEIFSDLTSPGEKFPVIIYAAGMNGSSWENIVLFDSLVHHGYIVAAISSVGKFPGYMSGAVDMEEQVNDVLYAIKKIKTLDIADTSHIGLLSWSLGGTAIVKAAMLSNDIKCLLSFDGTEIHYYGFDKAWDNEYNQIMKIPLFKPSGITVPYMYLSSEHPLDIDSIYLFPEYISSKDKYFLKFGNAIHEDFSSLPTIAKKAEPKTGNTDSSRHEIICSLALTYFDQYLKHSGPVSVNEYIATLIANKPASFDTAYPKH